MAVPHRWLGKPQAIIHDQRHPPASILTAPGAHWNGKAARTQPHGGQDSDLTRRRNQRAAIAARQCGEVAVLEIDHRFEGRHRLKRPAKERSGREAYQEYRERFYEALRKAGLPEG
jgi:hypothetical protein